uniref:NADH-ubiquinone oxidoreductase chain 2 n=1 Tax=Anadara vellicata TaxID=935000 RepID=A0A0P0D5R9_9BIVA|nr:NADH dehydrogenase subunit 2 [Anadara vellicata]
MSMYIMPLLMKDKFTPESVEWWRVPLSCFLLMAVFSALSVYSWFVAFLMMDVTTIIFLVMVSAESKAKYGLGVVSFVVNQSIASALLYLSYFLNYWVVWYDEYINLFSMIGLFWKIGLPPFHGWYSSVFMEVTWYDMFILSTVMKVPPAILVGSIIMYSDWYYLWWGMCVYALFYSSMAAAGQLTIRGVFAYSSISSSCWMVLGSVISEEIFFFIFLFIRWRL